MARRSVICLDRTNQSLCDVEIIAGTETDDDDDGPTSPILATKVFLYGISDKWKELIQSAHKTFPLSLTTGAESVKDNIFIPQIPREIMNKIIDFVYAGLRNEIQPLPLDDENAGKYFEAAKFLEMEEIETECLNYFDSKIITLENFSVLFKWSSTFGKEATQPKMRAFLTQNSQQIPEIMRRCKNELEIPEEEITSILIDWLPFSASEGENCDLDVERVIRQFSEKNEKIKLLDAFFETGDLEWSKTAFHLLRNLYKNGDQDSDSNQDDIDNDNEAGDLSCDSNSISAQHQVQNAAEAIAQPPKTKPVSVKPGSVKLTLRKSQPTPGPRKPETSKSSPVSRTPPQRTLSQRGPNLNSDSSGCQQPSTSKSSAAPVKKRRIQNNSTRSSSTSVVVELEREDSPEQQEQEQQIENDSDSGHSSSESSSSSTFFSLNASKAQRKRKFDKNNKLAQNSAAQGKIYFLLKNQNSPGGFHFWKKWTLEGNLKKEGNFATLAFEN